MWKWLASPGFLPKLSGTPIWLFRSALARRSSGLATMRSFQIEHQWIHGQFCCLWLFYLVVEPPLWKNMSQLGWLFPIYRKIKMFRTTNQNNFGNHQKMWTFTRKIGVEIVRPNSNGRTMPMYGSKMEYHLVMSSIAMENHRKPSINGPWLPWLC